MEYSLKVCKAQKKNGVFCSKSPRTDLEKLSHCMSQSQDICPGATMSTVPEIVDKVNGKLNPASPLLHVSETCFKLSTGQ